MTCIATIFQRAASPIPALISFSPERMPLREAKKKNGAIKEGKEARNERQPAYVGIYIRSLNKSLRVTDRGRRLTSAGVSFDSIRRINAGQQRTSPYRLLMTGASCQCKRSPSVSYS